MRNVFVVAATLVASLTFIARGSAQTTRPSTAAATQPSAGSAEEMLNQLLRPAGEAKPIQRPTTVQSGGVDVTSGNAAVAPGAPVLTVLREGTDIVNRAGRLTRSADGLQWEFTFESDGRTMLDPPMIILPNSKLMELESRAGSANRDPRFRITGSVTEYRGRNYILLQRGLVISDAEKQF